MFEGKKAFARTTIDPKIDDLLKYLANLQQRYPGYELECGYEAGCLGYSLYHQLTRNKYKCVILAPTTMPSTAKEIKTDRRDALKIAQCLANGTYSPVYVPTDKNNAVKEYIRMRDDAQALLKQTKQQINAMCLRHGYSYPEKSRWTGKHLKWLRELKLGDAILQEALGEYLITYDQLDNKLERLDQRIEELAKQDDYGEKGNCSEPTLTFLPKGSTIFAISKEPEPRCLSRADFHSELAHLFNLGIQHLVQK